MKLRRSILNFIQVRESESKLVQNLFIFEFFQGSAIALFFTAAISIFLNQLQANSLPKVYILSSFLLWGIGLLYHNMEHRYKLKKLIFLVVFINTVLIILFRVGHTYFRLESWYLYLFLASFNILYLLNNLEFWGLAAQIFDVRQSKRLFGVISAGDIPAKMIGYFSAYLIIPFIGTENLLIVAAALSATSLLLLNKLFNFSTLKHLQLHDNKIHTTHSIKNIQSALAGNRLIRKIAIVSFFSFAIYLMVNFIFYGYVKSAFKTDKSLVSFFAIFFGVTRLVTLIIKIAFANKMVDKMGLRNALMVSPLILFAICFTGLFVIWVFQIQHFTFYLFGVLIVITDVLRSAIQTPVLLSILQPLPVHQRLNGHTIIKGLMDPFAFLVSGIILVLFTSTSSIFNFEYLNNVLISLILLWAFFTWSVEQDYLKTLQTAIIKRSLSARDLEISDRDTIDYLLNKLKSGSESEAISVLKLVTAQTIEKHSFYIAGLNHPSEHVQMLTLEHIQHFHETSLLPYLKNILNDPHEESVKSELINTISILDKNFNFQDFIAHPNANIAYQAILSSLPNLSKNNPSEVESVLYQQLHFYPKDNKVNALKIIGKLKLLDFEHKVIELMNHPDKDIKEAARNAGASLGTQAIIIKLIDDFKHDKNDNQIIESLDKIGDASIPHFQSLLLASDCYGAKSRKLINLLGKINSLPSKHLLEKLLDEFTENNDAIIQALFTIDNNSSRTVEEINCEIEELLKAAVEILFQIKYIDPQNSVLPAALELELKNIRNKCLYWMYNLYDRETILKIKTGLTIGTKETVANALELVQMEVNNESGSLFSLLFENSSLEDKCLQLEQRFHFYPTSEVTIGKNILYDVNYHYNSWTKACVLYSINLKNNFLEPAFIQPFTVAKSEVLKNTAAYLFHQQIHTQ